MAIKEKKDSEIVLEFCVELSRRMILAGANVERIQLAVERICHAYALTDTDRVLLLLLSPIFPQRIVFVTLAALAAGLYGELLANLRRCPSTYFIYPAIIPLIPGDLFYYALVALYLGDQQMFLSNAGNCLVSLTGMSIGFVLSSIIAHYIRRVRFDRLEQYSR